MKKKFILPIMLGLIMLLGLSACHAPLSLKDVEKQNSDKWHVTYDLQGGVFSSQDGIDISHYYQKKDGGTYILEPGGSSGALRNLEIARPGYFLEGWYKTKECNYADKWNFSRDKITGDTMLYAKWLKSFEFRFLYKDGSEWKEVSSRSVSEGGKLLSSNKPTREGYTLLEWYEDEACQTVWDVSTPHSGKVENGDNEATRVVDVYTTWLEGDWAVVKTAIELTQAINANRNIYLYNDISFGEPDISTKSNWTAYTAEYDKTIEGNGFAIKNVIMSFPDSGAANEQGRRAYCAMFKKLLSGAKLRNVTFDNITLNVSPDNLGWEKYCALLATELEAGVTFENVTLSGTFNVTHKNPINLYNFGLAVASLSSGASLGGLDFTGVTVNYTYTGTGTAYTAPTDALGMITFEQAGGGAD